MTVVLSWQSSILAQVSTALSTHSLGYSHQHCLRCPEQCLACRKAAADAERHLEAELQPAVTQAVESAMAEAMASPQVQARIEQRMREERTALEQKVCHSL